jgi:hypothetical protein
LRLLKLLKKERVRKLSLNKRERERILALQTLNIYFLLEICNWYNVVL